MDNYYCAAAASTSNQLNTLDTSISSGGLPIISSIITNICFILKCICYLVVIILDIFMFISIVGHCLRREKNIWFLTGICFLLLAYFIVIVLVTAHLFYVDEISIEFLCQSYITVVALPHAIFWLNMQQNE